MFLSKLTFNLRSAEVVNALNNCQDMHINIMQGFDLAGEQGKEGVRAKNDILYRIIEGKKGIIAYVQSNIKPDWDKAIRSGIVAFDVKDITLLQESFIKGSIYRFNIECSPYIYIENKKRFIKDKQKREEWLQKVGAREGFEILAYNEQQTKSVVGIQRDKGSGFGCVIVEGVLRVTDKDKFKEAHKRGIGPRKAYGLGLLLLAKA